MKQEPSGVIELRVSLFSFRFRDGGKDWGWDCVAADLVGACRGFCVAHGGIEEFSVKRVGPASVVDVYSDGSGVEVTAGGDVAERLGTRTDWPDGVQPTNFIEATKERGEKLK